MSKVQPRFQAQMEGTIYPVPDLFQGKLWAYFPIYRGAAPINQSDLTPATREAHLVAQTARAALARIVAEHRRK